MPRNEHVLFYLDQLKRFRLSCDDLQWIVERGNPSSLRPGRDSGYRGISFVCTWKWILCRVLREKSVPVSRAGKLLIDCLPDHFDEFRDILRAIGIVEGRRWLYLRASKLIHDRSDITQCPAEALAGWDEVTSALSEPANEDGSPALSERLAS